MINNYHLWAHLGEGTTWITKRCPNPDAIDDIIEGSEIVGKEAENICEKKEKPSMGDVKKTLCSRNYPLNGELAGGVAANNAQSRKRNSEGIAVCE